MDNHNGMVSCRELGILKFEAKWALGSIAVNKASRGDGIPDEAFKF